MRHLYSRVSIPYIHREGRKHAPEHYVDVEGGFALLVHRSRTQLADVVRIVHEPRRDGRCLAHAPAHGQRVRVGAPRRAVVDDDRHEVARA
jgi:hypothetical protein